MEEKDIGFGMVDSKKDAKVAKKLGEYLFVGFSMTVFDQLGLFKTGFCGKIMTISVADSLMNGFRLE